MYYRIFDTELGSFAGGSAYLGSVEHSDFSNAEPTRSGPSFDTRRDESLFR